MFGQIVTQKYSIKYAICKIIYGVAFTLQNNEVDVKILLDHIRHHYSNMSVGVVGYGFDCNPGLRLSGAN